MTQPTPRFPSTRMRRNRRTPWSRDLVRENTLKVSDLIWPLFVIDGHNKSESVPSMPGVSRLTIDLAVEKVKEAAALGIPAVALFPYTDPKLRTADGREAYNPDNLICRAVTAVKKATGKNPTARHWFGYVSVQTFALLANQEKTVDGLKLAHAMQGFKLPPEIAMQPGAPPEYRGGDHQLMSTVFAGEAHDAKGDPDNVFSIRSLVAGEKAAGPVAETGCSIAFPA